MFLSDSHHHCRKIDKQYAASTAFEFSFRPAHDDGSFGRGFHLGISELINECENCCGVGETPHWPAR